MKLPAHVLLPVALALSASVVTSAAGASTPGDDAILAPVQALFDGMHHRDAAAIRAQALPGASMVLMRDGKPTQMTIDAFAERVGKPGKTQIEERIHDPIVHVDSDLAVVWAPFSFYTDGKLDHCGTDLFNLVRVDGAWRIASIADTGRSTCPLSTD